MIKVEALIIHCTKSYLKAMNLRMFILYTLHRYECVCKCTPLCAYTCVCAHVESTETGWMSSSTALLLFP